MAAATLTADAGTLAKHDLKKGVDFIGITCQFWCHDGAGNILLGVRSQKCRDERGCWDPGGGSMEFGETFESCVRREVLEETCVAPLEVKQVGIRNVLRTNHEGQPTHWIAVIFAVRIPREGVKIGEPEKLDDLKWFSPDKFPTPLHSQFWPHYEIVKATGALAPKAS